MNYQETKEYMKQMSNLGSKLGLDTIRELLNRLGNPQDRLRFIHVAGTNGKGSTCAFIANILAHSGYRVGRYISPVVREDEECIQVSETGPVWGMIEKEQVAQHITRIRQQAEAMVEDGYSQPTYYEMETAMAMLEFERQQCDLVVLETLMGGKLDATNVVSKVLVCIFTSISMDHMQYLGNSLREIATQKAGIIKPGVPVILEKRVDEASEVLIHTARENHSPVFEVDQGQIQVISTKGEETSFTFEGRGPYKLRLLGEHQVKNAALSIVCAQVLNKAGFTITEEAIEKGISSTQMFGRFTIVKRNPMLIVDGAHNLEATQVLKSTLLSQFGQITGVFIMGVFADKDYEGMLDELGTIPRCLITVTAPGPRGLDSAKLANVAKKYCRDVLDGGSLTQALTLATNLVSSKEYILCFGSLSYLGEIEKIAMNMDIWKN